MANSPDLLIHRLRALLDPARHETASDGDLLARWVRQQDPRAFAALIWRHGAVVWRVSRGILKHHEDAQDVFQATYFVLAKKAATLQHRPSIAGWLHETAHRLALKARTASARRLRRESQTEQKPAPDPLEELSVCEARAILDEELQRLPAEDRDALLLCLYEGATQEEAARQLHCSLSTLKRRLERGRTLLADQLTRRGLAPASALAVTLWSTARAPAELAQQTVMAIERLAAGHVVSGAGAAMADALLRAMFLKKAVIGIALMFAFGSLTVAGGLTFAPAGNWAAAKDHGARRAALEIEQPQPAPPKDLPPRLDGFGDALPPGAINRLGSIRLRHGDGVAQVLYTPDGKSLASIAWDGFVRLWDVPTGKLSWRFAIDKARSYQSALAVSADGKKLAVLGNSDYDLLATETGKSLTRHELPEAAADERVRSLAIAPDLTTIARGFFDATVRLYDAATGEEKFRITIGDKAQNDLPLALTFSADTKTLYVAGRNTVDVMAFDTATGKSLRPLKGERLSLRPLVVSHDLRMLAAFRDLGPNTAKDSDAVLLWDLTTGKLRHSLLKSPSASCGAFSPDGSLLAVGSLFMEVVLFDTASGKEKGRLQGCQGAISLAFAPDGKTIAAADNTGCITVWDVATCKLLPPSPEPHSGYKYGLHFLAGGKQLGSFGRGVSWWDVATGQSIMDRRPEPSRFRQYEEQSISPDEKLLVRSLSEQLPDGTFKSDILLIDTATEKPVRTLSGHKWHIFRTAFSSDGTKLFSAAGFDPRVIVWDVATGKAVHVLESHTHFVNRLAVSPDGRWLASASTQPGPGEDSDIRLWDVATGKLMRRLTPRTFSGSAMVFSADSSLLVTAGFETQLWDVATGKEMRVIPGQKDAGVWCVAMASDGRMLATGTGNILQLWEVATGAERRRIEGHEGTIYALAFSPDSTVLAASSCDAPIYLWDVYGRKINQSATGKLKKEGQERLWQQLADTDATLAFEAICELIRRPVEAIALLEEGWKRYPRVPPKQMEKWVDDLDSVQFTVRKNATAELERFVTGHEGLLRKALDQSTTLEVRQRLENILNRPNPERLRRGRVLEVLEQVATAPTRQLLQTLADQKEDAQLAAEAKASLQRLLER